MTRSKRHKSVSYFKIGFYVKKTYIEEKIGMLRQTSSIISILDHIWMEHSMQSKMYTFMEKTRYYHLHKWLMHANKKTDKRQTAMLAK